MRLVAKKDLIFSCVNATLESHYGCVSTQSHKHVFQVGFEIRDFNHPHPEKYLPLAGIEPMLKTNPIRKTRNPRHYHLRH